MLSVIVTLIVIGVLLWLVTAFIPMNATIQRIIIAVVVIAVVLWLLNIFGLLAGISNVPIPRVGR